MARTTAWEYAILTQEGEREMIEIEYAGGDHVANEDVPKGALGFTLGSLGNKGWELVSVTASWRGDSVYVTTFYFKRQHDGDRGLKN
ncbi:MAG TPA: hypothetical protein VH482_22275 [Thermomicrobiales bacterium]|jgi:hypothetical protein